MQLQQPLLGVTQPNLSFVYAVDRMSPGEVAWPGRWLVILQSQLLLL